MTREKIIIGRQEWCAMPDLNIKRVRAKIDTGAKTSALHAEEIKCVEKSDGLYVQFKVLPFPQDYDKTCLCEAKVVDKRHITSSNNTKEMRYIIHTQLLVAGVSHTIELSLTNRHLMRFNLLLGREALNQFAIVDPSKTYVLGPIEEK